jgi:competence protein ComEC
MPVQQQSEQPVRPEQAEDPPPPLDARMALPALAGWASAAVVLGLRAEQGLLVASGLALACAGACWLRRWLLALVLVVASAIAVLAVLRVVAVAAGPVPALAQAHAEVDVEMVVTSAAVRREGQFTPYVLFRARVELVSGRGDVREVRSPVLVIADKSWSDVVPGARVFAEGRLEPADGPDLAGVLVTHGGAEALAAPGVLARGAEGLRDGLRRAVSGLGPVERVLIPALVNGDDAGMPLAAVEDFRTSGLTHLLAVSGTNLTLVLGFLLLVARWCGVRAHGLAVVGVLGIVGFVLLARPEPSVLRAAAMGAVALAGLGPRGGRRGVRALSTAVVVLLLVDPWLARSVGFLLSALATAGIVLLAPGWRAALAVWLPHWLAEALAVPMAAQAVCTPVIAAISGQVSLVAVFANLAAAPAVGPATVLGLITCLVAPVSLSLAAAIGQLAGVAAWWIATIAEQGAGLAGASVPWPANAASLSLLGALCVVLMAGTPRLLARRWWCLAVTVVLVVVLVRPPTELGWPPPNWVMVACDVGQGDALVLSAGAGSAVVVDTGPDPRAMDRCLDRLGVSAVPLVVLTHLHADHVSGLPGVLAGRRVGEVEIGPLDTPPEQLAAVQEWTAAAGVPLTRATYGEQRAIADLGWTVIGPVARAGTTSSAPVGEEGSSENNASLVLMVDVRGTRLLLTGDVEPPAQQALLASGVDLHADVLKVAHHGSRYQEPAFIDAVHAELAVISVGGDNDYGHPSPETLALVEQSGAVVERTDTDGDVAVVVTSDGLAVSTRQ